MEKDDKDLILTNLHNTISIIMRRPPLMYGVLGSVMRWEGQRISSFIIMKRCSGSQKRRTRDPLKLVWRLSLIF